MAQTTAKHSPPDQGSLFRLLALSGAARFITLPVSGASTILTTRLVSSEYGLESYGVFALVAFLPLIFPFADLGLGAAVVNAAADLDDRPREFRSVFRYSVRWLSIIGALLALVCAILGITGRWTHLLGIPALDFADGAISFALVMFALSIPSGLGVALLTGRNRSHWTVVVQAAGPLVNVGVAWLLTSLHASLWTVLATSTAGYFVGNLVCFMIAIRLTEVRRALTSDQNHLTDGDTAPIVGNLWGLAIPMLVITIAGALTFQGNRLLLSHFSTLSEVARYSAAWMVFQPALSVVQTAGRSLWAPFAAMKKDSSRVSLSFHRSLALLGLAGFISLLVMYVAGPFVSSWAVGQPGIVGHDVMLCLGLLLWAFAVHQPSGMLLTDSSGLRFQAITMSVACVAQVSLGILATIYFGAAGLLWCLLATSCIVQIVPCFIRAEYLIRKEWTSSGR